jgi:lipoic acid synthetase
MSVKPDWVKIRVRAGDGDGELRRMLEVRGLNTICRSARCPNLHECYSRKIATFLILGERCTRNCRYCSVPPGQPFPPDPDEPRRLAKTAREMGLKYVTLTSPARDDLDDGGAAHYVAVIEKLREYIPGVKVETLIPDFRGDVEALKTVMDARPDVLNHNMEAVERLFPTVRSGGDFRRSLELLSRVKEIDESMTTKSGFMVGLGETHDDIRSLLADLSRTRVDMVTIGQYLQPTPQQLPVVRHVTPEEFETFRDWAQKEYGIRHCFSGVFVRSSYHAADTFERV